MRPETAQTFGIPDRHLFFTDRHDAGRRLASTVYSALAGTPSDDLVVLGLPRGGIPVAQVVALRLGAPLSVLVARKLAAPTEPELAVGAIAEAGARFVDDDLAARCGVTAEMLDEVERQERVRLTAQCSRFGTARRPSLRGKTVVIVDDGLATGATARAACRAARLLGASRVVLAVPGAPTDWRWRMADEADELISVGEEDVPAVGCWYADFGQVSDDDVLSMLAPSSGDS